MVVPGRGPSSRLTLVPSGNSTGVISRSKNPFFWASTARFWDMTANSSMRSRLTPYFSATFSAVSPMAMYMWLTKSGRDSSTNLALASSRENPLPAVRLTLSTPPATKVSPSPALMAWKAIRIDWRDEAQKRLTLVPGTVSGSPPSMAMLRAMFMPCSPTWLAAPMITSSTSAGATAGTLSMRVLMMKPPRSSMRASLSDPLKARPIGERAVATMTASGIRRAPFDNCRSWRWDLGCPASRSGRAGGGFGAGLGRRWWHHPRLGDGDRGPAPSAYTGQLAEKRDGSGVIVARAHLYDSVTNHPVHDLPTYVGAHDGQRPVVEGADPAGRDVGVLGREVRTELAPLPRPGGPLLG